MSAAEEEKMAKMKLRLKKLVRELGRIRGRHTELVTVYVPAGYSLSEITSQLRSEQSTAENIKSKQVRKNVTSALDKIIRHLQLFKSTPQNGLALFCGNVSEQEAKDDIEMWVVEPPEPVKVKMYWCDQRFVTDPLEEMVAEKEIYGIINLDRSEADIALLVGKKIEPLVHFESIVPGKTRAGGQCLDPSSLVQLSNGEIVEIRELHNPSSVKSSDFESFRLTDSPVIDKWDVEKTSKYRIVTKLPRTEIEASPDHLFFTWGDEIKEKAAEELKTGDYLLMPEKISVKGELQALNSSILYNSYKISEEGRKALLQARKRLGISQKSLSKRLGATQAAISVIELNKRNVRFEFLVKICKELGIDLEAFIRRYCVQNSKISLPETLDERLSQILGYFAGDGSFEKERLSFHEKDEETIRIYNSLVKSVFKCNSHLRFRPNKGFWVLRAHGKPVVRLLISEFPEIKGFSDTEIPKKVLKSEDTVLASFLRGFFDAEGYVSPKRGIGLGINNKKLAKQVQISLLRFGILASLHEYDNRRNPYSKKTRFTVSMTEKESLENFYKYIGFSVPYKAKRLESVLKEKYSISYTRRIAVSGKNIRKILEQNGMKVSDFSKVTNFFRNERLMSKTVFLNSILKELKNRPELHHKLKAILDYNLVPVKIKKIEKIEIPSKMVDIAVKNQNFVANGLIVHNSSARFSRVREGLLNDWLKQVAEAANKIFMEKKEVIGVIVSGPGPIKDIFLKEEYLFADVRNRVLGTVDTSYTGEFGVEETIQRGAEIFREAAVMKEKKILERFFTELQKPYGLAVYGFNEVRNAIEAGAVDFVILSETLEARVYEYADESGALKTGVYFIGKEVPPGFSMSASKDAIEYFEDKAINFGSRVELVSRDTREGEQFLQLGGIGAILRYRIS